VSNKNIRDLLLALSVIGANEYSDYYIDDNEVNDCLMSMYFYMMCDNKFQQKKDELFKKFNEKYEKLNEEQQELVKQDYLSIIEAQNKNRNKVKRKGDRYE